MKIMLFILFLSHSLISFGDESSFRKLICTPSKKEARIEVIFPKLIHPLKPFIGFPEMWVEVTVERPNMGWIYRRERVLMIPERTPPGVEMRGQSSDSLYIKLSPEIYGGEFTGTYFGQLFVNDHESERRSYFRYMDSELGPGIVCRRG